jgi:hypothetical protein
MTRKEFEKLRLSVEEEDFFGNCSSPIEFGIQRAAFEKKKFQKLIAMARKVNFKTTRAKAQQWHRQLERAKHSLERFHELKKEIEAARIQIQPAPVSSANGRRQFRA